MTVVIHFHHVLLHCGRLRECTGPVRGALTSHDMCGKCEMCETLQNGHLRKIACLNDHFLILCNGNFGGTHTWFGRLRGHIKVLMSVIPWFNVYKSNGEQ